MICNKLSTCTCTKWIFWKMIRFSNRVTARSDWVWLKAIMSILSLCQSKVTLVVAKRCTVKANNLICKLLKLYVWCRLLYYNNPLIWLDVAVATNYISKTLLLWVRVSKIAFSFLYIHHVSYKRCSYWFEWHYSYRQKGYSRCNWSHSTPES